MGHTVTLALINGSAVCAIFETALQAGYQIAPLFLTAGPLSALGPLNADPDSPLHAYSIVPVVWDTPPANSYEPDQSTRVETVVGDHVEITRTWAANPVYVPDMITNAQARYVLMQTPSSVNQGKTLFDDVNAAVTAGGGIDQMAWEYSNNINRNSSLVASMAGSLGMTSAQIDALFIASSAVTF